MSDELAAPVHSLILDGRGGSRSIPFADIGRHAADDGLLWLHLDHGDRGSERWLRDDSGVDPVLVDALLADAPRPRCVALGDGLLVILRGINLNHGAEPEDMVSVRLWLEPSRVISLRSRRVMAVADMRADLEAGRGPSDPAELLCELTDRLLGRIGEVVEELDDTADQLEDQLVDQESRELRPQLAQLRRKAISLRRYLAPQRQTINRLQNERVSWMSDRARASLRESDDRLHRFIEDIDSARERAAVTQEELQNRLAEQTNRTMYFLSVVAAIFLPLGLLTGLLGINVGGMPGADTSWGFGVVCVMLVVLAVFEVVLFRRLRWL